MAQSEQRIKYSGASGLHSDDEVRELIEKAALAEVYLDLARRTKAELFNYQDRVDRERQLWSRAELIDFVRDLLPVLDALSCARCDNPALAEGIRKIEQEFVKVLARYGIVPIPTHQQTLDPELHDAVAIEETTQCPPLSIVQELQAGWMMGGRVLRPAAVRVAKRPAKVSNRGDETATL